MKKLNLILIARILISGKLFAQGMTPPDPIKSTLMESMAGTWVSEPYDMMGTKVTEETTMNMVLNGQFMEVHVKSKSDIGPGYEGMGIFAPDNNGNITGTFYDIFGKGAISTYTGTSEPNKLYLTGNSAMGKDVRNFTMNGNIMIQDVILNLKDANGKEMPPISMSITYNKK